MKSALTFYLILLLGALSLLPAFSQDKTTALSTTARWASTVNEQYWIQPDITYGVANNYTLKLDVWQRKDQKSPAPTLIYYRGGGWIIGDRTGATLLFLPYLEMGWNVINVEYRMASVSLAPAAVEDCRCALRWALKNAKQYNIDVNRIVLTGHSAGGHLSLITGMLPEGTGFDNNCDGTEKLKVAAIINWYGVSDVADVVQGPNRKNYAVMWMGSQPDPLTIAKRVSPLTYVRAGARKPRSRCALRSVDAAASGSYRGGCAERTGDDQGRRPRAVYGRRIRRCLPQDQRFATISWPAAVGLTASLAALKRHSLIVIPLHD